VCGSVEELTGCDEKGDFVAAKAGISRLFLSLESIGHVPDVAIAIPKANPFIINKSYRKDRLVE
jgi:hypothetical protein